jgi:hypothetical protein
VSQSAVNLESVIELARQLNPLDKLRLVERVIPDLEPTLRASSHHPLKTYYGALSDLGPAPSADDIAEVRRDMFERSTED